MRVADIAASGAVVLGRGLREGLFMFWQTLWPLVLGFGLSGMVQAFASRDGLRRRLGTHGPAATARASAYGMASSSCSYAASAMAKSLFANGADFVTSLVFMFASTNLVVELGLVLIVLLGWQFAASEFVGGAIMIVLLVLLASRVLVGPHIEERRARLANRDHAHDAHDAHDVHDAQTPTSSIRTRAGWADAARYTLADLTMLRWEMLIGYALAGLLATAVPASWWSVVFLRGHGFWTSVENAVVGPLIAIVSFVCSVGNIPLAAALWHGGISFGGVVSFVFADLITLPLLLVYRRYYGTRTMLRMLAVFWAVMSAAGLATEGLFAWWHLIPTTRSGATVEVRISWDATTWLNLVFLLVLGALWWVAHPREGSRGGSGYAIDPICGMQVRTATAPARVVAGDTTVYFCSDRCAARYSGSGAPSDSRDRDLPGPESYQGGTMARWWSHEHAGHRARPRSMESHRDPICQMVVDPAHAAAQRTAEGVEIYFCSVGCAAAFDAKPAGH